MTQHTRLPRTAEVLPPAAPAHTTWYEVLAEDEKDRGGSLRRPVIAGALAILIGFGGFLAWGFSAELDSAAVATGSVIVDSKKKTVSHLEGGILKRLLVQEGERVREGQPLMELDDTRARSELAQLHGERAGLLAKLARLRAEQAGQADVAFPNELRASDDSLVAEIMADERQLFVKRQKVYEAKVEHQRKQIEQHAAEAEALSAQIEARERQSKLVGGQLKDIRALANDGYATRTRVIELETQWSNLVGDSGEFKAQKAKAEQAKAAAEIGLLSIQMERQSDIATEIQDAQLRLNDVTQRITKAEDVLKRLRIRAPQDGIVANIQMRTPGGVITPAQPLMDIVPENEPLVIEASINRADIDAVRVGAPTQVRLTAYNYRTLKPLDGRLTYVAADQTVDEARNSSYYVVRAEIAPEALAAHPGVSLYPGMPAELLILNRPRTAIDYILSPITESLNRSFREE